MSNGAHTSTSPPIPLRTIRPPPSREDYWSEEATHTLIESWGARYLELGRGHLRQNHWDEVAAAVNAVHGQTKRTRRTDVQCKNRIDTIKKKYKIEKARDVASKGDYVSPWPFFPRLDSIIGGTTTKKNKISPPPPPPPPTTMMVRRRSPNTPALGLLAPIPVAPRSKRPITVLAPENSFLRRHISAVAVAAAAADETESDSSDSESEGRGKRERDEDEEEEGEERGCRELAEAIARFGEVYERVEVMKQEKLMELEKQRMRFAMDLEFQRMKLLTDIHVQMAKVKRAKSTTTGDADADADDDDDGDDHFL